MKAKAVQNRRSFFRSALIALSLTVATGLGTSFPSWAQSSDLASWNDGPVKDSIVKFVQAVTDEKGPDYVEPAKRIAVFDNDGTLWCEQPIYPQVVFVAASAKDYAKAHPEVANQEIFRAAIDGDIAKLASIGPKGTQELVNYSHKGMTVDEFSEVVTKWMAASKHPRYDQPYNACVYKPMIEVIAYLKKNGFKNYIVSGGGAEFMRPWTDKTYDIPPEHVIGSTCKLQFVMNGDKPEIQRMLEVDFICDRDRKPVAIERTIGRRPIAAFGNSNGDQQMLEWTAAGSGKRLAALVHHTDDVREYAYDRNSKVGRLDKALDEAIEKKWTVIDMKKDWNQVFSFQTK